MGSPCPGTTRDRSQFPRSRLHVEVTSFAAYFAVYRRSARITGNSDVTRLGKGCGFVLADKPGFDRFGQHHDASHYQLGLNGARRCHRGPERPR